MGTSWRRTRGGAACDAEFEGQNGREAVETPLAETEMLAAAHRGMRRQWRETSACRLSQEVHTFGIGEREAPKLVPEVRMAEGLTRSSRRRSAVVSSGLLLAPVALLMALACSCCFCQLAVAQFTNKGYFGDKPYLELWGESIPNFPVVDFWNSLTGSQPCPSGEWFGVFCNDQGYVNKIDLSFSTFPEGMAKLWGRLDYNLTGLIYLEELNLAGNAFYGRLPPQWAYFLALKNLTLDNNRLSGPIGDALCQLNLTCLHLSNNNFTGRIPSCLSRFPCADFAGNSKLNYTVGVDCQPGPQSCTVERVAVAAPPPPPPTSSGPSLGLVLGCVIGAVVLLVLLVVLFVMYRKHEERRRKAEEEAKMAADIETQVQTRHFGTLKRFTVEELAKATNNFDEDNVLGEGGYARVFKGKLVVKVKEMVKDDKGKDVEQEVDKEIDVAVKRVKEERRAGGELAFLNEVEVISRAVHKNLLTAQGFCVTTGECMLVLPFMRNGSVASRTQGKEGNPMDWPTRQRVARGAAEGVAYLHKDCAPKIIHRDIKADNVLLNDKDEPAVADFGLAVEIDVKQSHKSTGVQGTIGYMPPEYVESGQVSEKTDVYAFGVFLLELTSGRSVYQLSEELESQEISLRDWVISVVKEGRTEKLVDAELPPSEYDIAEVEHMLQVALVCMNPLPSKRPDMEEVARVLATTELTDNWEQWQAEAGTLRAEDLMQVVNKKALWDEGNTTGISMDAFGLSGPR